MAYHYLKVSTPFLLAIFGTFFALPVPLAHALDQNVTVTINSDFTAEGTWALPLDRSTKDYLYFEEFKDFGEAGVTSYIVKSVSTDNKGRLKTNQEPGGVSVLHLDPTHSIQNMYVNYDIRTALTRPVAIYEVWIAGGNFFKAPKLTINYPKGWKLVGAWPRGTDDGQSLTIAYPNTYTSPYPVLVAFIPTNIGFDHTIAKVGRFTIVGPNNSVKKLEQAVAKMGFLTDLYSNTIAATPPENIFLYSADLSEVSVGYEAQALATKPNLILYNDLLLGSQSLPEIESALVHEIAHLTELERSLFNGAIYNAPWFREGFAVFMENQSRPYIYPQTQNQGVADLIGITHMFSASELKKQYEKPFSYSMTPSQGTPSQDLYAHAGIVVTNFFNKVGAQGMQKLLIDLQKQNSSPYFERRDTDLVLSSMSRISDIYQTELLFPYKTSLNFERDVAALTYPSYDSSTIDAAARYIQNSAKKFFAGGSSLPASTPVRDNSALGITSKALCGINHTLRLGMRDTKTDIEVAELQNFLIGKGYLAAKATGYFGNLTLSAVQKWQKAQGLAPDGVFGPSSQALFAKLCK